MEVSERLKALWNWRMSEASIQAEEMHAFGWWFGSGRMDPDWSLQILTRLLSASVLPEPDYMVTERLAVIAEEQPLKAVQSLDWLIELAPEGWTIHGWLDSAQVILEAALESVDTEAKERAERVIHRLGALRFREFRTLLQR